MTILFKVLKVLEMFVVVTHSKLVFWYSRTSMPCACMALLDC